MRKKLNLILALILTLALAMPGMAFAEDSGYDAARELLGAPWRMPTTEDLELL